MTYEYKQDPEIQAAGKQARSSEIDRLVTAGFSRERATEMVDSFIQMVTRRFEREIMEHGTGGSPLFRLLNRTR